nr:T9SS type A sorting domain-containing protein [Candidatus Cloacimonadota bacterium]
YKDNGEFYLDPDSLGHHSGQQGDPNNQAWYQIGSNTYYTGGSADWQWELYTAENTIMNVDTDATLVLGHARLGTTGYGNHPFRLEIENDPDKVYSFIHNGTITDEAKEKIFNELLGIDWFDDHPSNWEGIPSPGYLSTWIDSEILFHWIMYNINECNGDAIIGIRNAIIATIDNGNYNLFNNLFNDPHQSSTYPYLWVDVANFILSDGENLYVYRNSIDGDSGHRLSYLVNEEFTVVKTDTDILPFTKLDQHDLVCISQYGDDATLFSNIYANYWSNLFFSGTINGNETWTTTKLITDNVTILQSAVLNVSSSIDFLTHSNFNIYGLVNVNQTGELKLDFSSTVTINGTNAELFLDWGSTITGSTPTTYGATPPGQPVGGERPIPGDRIIAQNGGIITTGDIDDFELHPGYPNNVPEAIISSSAGELWDGIFIQNPDDDAYYWFVNCDISWIRKLSIENIGESRNTAYLNLYLTDFHDAGQIVVRDGHELSIQGEEGVANLCYFQNNPVYPICAYESPVYLNYVHIGGTEEEPELGNGGGIYLYDSATPLSIINNCNFMYNNSEGVKLNGVAFRQFNNNNIENNTGFGMLCYPSTSFLYDDFNLNTLRDNGCAEYAGWQNTFRMDNPDADITIVDTDYGSGSDQYLLMDILWDGIHSVNVRGTNLSSNDLPHLFPSDQNAWYFGGVIEDERLMLYSASNDISNGNYTTAEQTLQQIILDYQLTQEAGIAVYYLYHLEIITDQDFPDLRDYLENISFVVDTPLEKAAEKIITKSFVKDKDYLTAIDRLENTINNSQILDEVIMAMIDEGYCYMELSDEGERGLPVNCTVKTSTLDEYQAKVRELESQFSFYPEEQDQESIPIAGNILSLVNYPNPFNPSTTISFSLKNSSNVKLTVYNVKGQKVTTLVDKHFENGSHTVTWNGKDSNNKSVSSGIYFYKISSGKSSAMKKMLLLK